MLLTRSVSLRSQWLMELLFFPSPVHRARWPFRWRCQKCRTFTLFRPTASDGHKENGFCELLRYTLATHASSLTLMACHSVAARVGVAVSEAKMQRWSFHVAEKLLKNQFSAGRFFCNSDQVRSSANCQSATSVIKVGKKSNNSPPLFSFLLIFTQILT